MRLWKTQNGGGPRIRMSAFREVSTMLLELGLRVYEAQMERKRVWFPTRGIQQSITWKVLRNTIFSE